MNDLGFLSLVQRMRCAQKRWFRYRDQAALAEAKRLEREVDQILDQTCEPERSAQAMLNFDSND